MIAEIYIIGSSKNGFEIYPNTDLFGEYDTSQKSFFEIKRIGNSVAYVFIQSGLLDADGRAGSSFGLIAIIDKNYNPEPKELISFLESIYVFLLKEGILIKKNEYFVPVFVPKSIYSVEDYLKKIIKGVINEAKKKLIFEEISFNPKTEECKRLGIDALNDEIKDAILGYKSVIITKKYRKTKKTNDNFIKATKNYENLRTIFAQITELGAIVEESIIPTIPNNPDEKQLKRIIEGQDKLIKKYSPYLLKLQNNSLEKKQTNKKVEKIDKKNEELVVKENKLQQWFIKNKKVLFVFSVAVILLITFLLLVKPFSKGEGDNITDDTEVQDTINEIVINQKETDLYNNLLEEITKLTDTNRFTDAITLLNENISKIPSYKQQIETKIATLENEKEEYINRNSNNNISEQQKYNNLISAVDIIVANEGEYCKNYSDAINKLINAKRSFSNAFDAKIDIKIEELKTKGKEAMQEKVFWILKRNPYNNNAHIKWQEQAKIISCDRFFKPFWLSHKNKVSPYYKIIQNIRTTKFIATESLNGFDFGTPKSLYKEIGQDNNLDTNYLNN